MTIIRPVNIVKFIKKDGTERRMTYVAARDMSGDEILARVKGDGSHIRKLGPGMETVWDLNESQWRTVNKTTLLSSLCIMAEVML
jgi:hypothetical protein